MHIHSITGPVLFFLLLDDLPPARSRFGAAGGGVVIGNTALDAPVEDVIVLIALANEQVTEQLAKVGVIRLVVEAESAGVVKEDAELVGETTAQKVGGSRHLLLHDAVVLLLLGGGLEALPGKSATKEVHEDVCKGLDVIPAGLFDT